MSARSVIPMLLFGLGLPAFILYSIFFSGIDPKLKPIAELDRYQSEISGLTNQTYQVLGVTDEGGSLRVNTWLRRPASGDRDIQMQTLNALYDVQTHTGQKLSVSVWMYRSSQIRRSDLLGLAFFRALTGQTVYKNASELQ